MINFKPELHEILNFDLKSITLLSKDKCTCLKKIYIICFSIVIHKQSELFKKLITKNVKNKYLRDIKVY